MRWFRCFDEGMPASRSGSANDKRTRFRRDILGSQNFVRALFLRVGALGAQQCADQCSSSS